MARRRVSEAEVPEMREAVGDGVRDHGERLLSNVPKLPSERSDAAPGKAPPIPKPWGAIVETTFRFDPAEAHERLVRELSLGDHRTDYGTVLRGLDLADRNSYDAAALHRRAKLEDQAYAQEVEVKLEVLRLDAIEKLEVQKAKGARSKAPTIADIRGQMLVDHGDEVRALERRQAELHGAAAAVESLAAAWRSRAETLREMARRHRAGG